MSIPEYFETIKVHLITNPLVENFKVIRERITATDGHIRVRLNLVKGCMMEFSEYVNVLPNGSISVITYSYHCTDTSGQLVVRWDNAPHFPDLPNFPYHKHSGCPEIVQSDKPMDIFKSLDEIKQILNDL